MLTDTIEAWSGLGASVPALGARLLVAGAHCPVATFETASGLSGLYDSQTAMDVWDYFEDRQQEIAGYSAVLEPAPGRPLFQAAPDDLTGRFFGNLGLTENAYLRVQEWVAIEAGAVVITRYAYYLVRNEAEVWGFEKDPSHDPPVHGHIGEGHTWVEAPEISLAAALERSWEELSQDA